MATTRKINTNRSTVSSVVSSALRLAVSVRPRDIRRCVDDATVRINEGGVWYGWQAVQPSSFRKQVNILKGTACKVPGMLSEKVLPL